MNITSPIARWIGERVRDAVLWPVNLVRDFPARSGRLLRTVGRGLVGIVRFMPGAIYAARQGQLRSWLRPAAGRMAGWAHLFVVQLFDLSGGPEIAQFLMHLITNTTPLSENEIRAMSSVLGAEAMRYREARVAEGGLFDLIFKLNGNLAFATWRTINLPRNGRHTRANLPLVIHELTHVYQYERVGSRYLGEAIIWLVRTKRDCYDYGFSHGLQAALAAGRRYGDYNREQQAQMVQDYYTLKQKGADVTAYEPFIAQLRAGEL